MHTCPLALTSGDRSEQQQQQESCLLPVTAPVQYWAAESGITCYFVTVELDVAATEHHSTTDSLLLQQLHEQLPKCRTHLSRLASS